MTSPLGVAVGLLSLKGGLLTNCYMCLLLIARMFLGVGRLGPLTGQPHSLVAVVTPTERHKSVCNRCVIGLFVTLFVLSLCPFDISVIGLSQISPFLFIYQFLRHYSKNFCETWLVHVYRQYLVLNPMNFQVRTPNVMVTVRHNRKYGQCYNLQMARHSLNNSSIQPTYFLPTR